MRVRRELGRVAVAALAVALLALLVHTWNDGLSAAGLAARAAGLFGVALLVQLLRLAGERTRRHPAVLLVVAWVAYAVALGAAAYLLPVDEVSFRQAALGGVLFATLMAPLELWDARKAERRKREDRELEDARLDREHEARLARAERTWLPH